jgi:dienelactone hydrolase
VALVLALLAAACSSGDTNAKGDAADKTTTTVASRGDEPAYAEPGPYKVGFTTMRMDDRDVNVWYPADAAATTGKPKATYDQATPLPDKLKGLVPKAYNTVVTMDAYADAPANTEGPFPVLLFAHGAGGYGLVNSGIEVGMASWGFVVVAVDYLEYGLVAQVTGAGRATKRPTEAEMRQRSRQSTKRMLASLDLVQAEGEKADSVLHGAVDASRAASSGHSAGGAVAWGALADPRVKVAIGWAPVPAAEEPVDKPTMIIGATGDSALTPAELAKTYAGFPAPKRFVEIGPAGHNTFTDICGVIRQGGGLVEFARQNKLVSENLLELAYNGCTEKDLEGSEFWPVVQHFTVAGIRDALGIDSPPVGLGDGIESAFAGVTIRYVHNP